MDSPERTLTISPAEVEGSPLFNFLCTLSPIKPVKSVHVAQSFSEISFPPPPSVFVSPRADLRKDFRSHEGNESKSGGEEVQSNGRHIFVRTAKRAQKFGKNTIIGSPSNSPSKLIEEYLTNPIGGEQNMEIYYSDVLKYEDGEEKNYDTNDSEVESAIESKSSPSLQLDKSLYTCIFSEDAMFNEQKACSVKSNQCNTQRISLSNACQRSGDDENQLDFDEDESDFKFLMSEEDQILQSYRFMGDWHTEGGPSNLSELSVEQVEIYIDSLRDVVVEEHEMKSMEKLTESSRMLKCKENDNRVNAPMQRGTRRRCLDFEVSDNHAKMKTNLSVSMPISQEKPVEPTNPLVILKDGKSPHNLDAAIQNHSQDDTLSTVVTCTKSTTVVFSNCTSSKDPNHISCSTHVSPIPSSMPSGIGLHLNSLSETTPLHEINSSSGSIALMKPLRKSLHGSSIDDSKHVLRQGNSKGDIVSLMEKTSVQECEHKSKCPESVINSSRSITYSRSVTLGIKRVAESNGFDKRTIPLCRKRVLLTDLPHPTDSDRLDECNQSPKKRRRLSSANDKSGDGCKHCNCKKSKCLKLYCECFAAGVYCIGNCSCQGCLNKPEFEEIVLETRQQIESRNPLAFAPKIMRAAESSPSNKEDYHESPAASARHKRGCNCKKSRCLKKYCECYQVGVGCSDGCRCENCENVYGRKESAENFEEKDIQVETGDKECKEQIHTLDCSKEGIDDGCQLQNTEMSPITPFEYRSKSRNITKSRSTASRRSFSTEELQSPTFCLSASTKQSRSPSNLPGSSKGAQSNSPGAPVKSSLPKVGSSPISTPRIMRIGQFSPRWDGLSDICTITPLPQAPARPTVATPVSGIDGIDSSPSMNEHQPDRVLRNSPNLADKFTSRIPQHHHHKSSWSSIQPEASLMRGTPPTPLFPSSRVMGKNTMPPKEPEEEEQKESGHQFVGLETPKFLRDHEVGCSTICLLNSSSPKHKRISPPHHCNGLRETSSHRELQSPSSTSRRKFILRSISSIPPIPFPAAHEQPIGSTSCPNET